MFKLFAKALTCHNMLKTLSRHFGEGYKQNAIMSKFSRIENRAGRSDVFFMRLIFLFSKPHKLDIFEVENAHYPN